MRGEKRMKIIALVRTHNSSWIIKETLNALINCVDGIIIHDHNSEDDTVTICNQYTKVLEIFQTKDPTYHEGRDKAILLNIGKKYNPDWFLMMDDDEVVFDNFEYVLNQLTKTKYKSFAFPLLYLWGGQDKVRIDMPWCKQFRTKLVKNSKRLHFELKKCHCSPQHPYKEMASGVPILHYGYVDQKLIDEKLKLYKTFDEKTNGMKMGDLEKAFVKEGTYCTVSEAIKRKVWL